MSEHQKAIDKLNEIWAKILGQLPRKNPFLYWHPPRNWKGTKYAFGYTPWQTIDPDTKKKGFFALKYRILRKGSMRLVKAVRFGKRKVAKERAYQWHKQYYQN